MFNPRLSLSSADNSFNYELLVFIVILFSAARYPCHCKWRTFWRNSSLSCISWHWWSTAITRSFSFSTSFFIDYTKIKSVWAITTCIKWFCIVVSSTAKLESMEVNEYRRSPTCFRMFLWLLFGNFFIILFILM